MRFEFRGQRFDTKVWVPEDGRIGEVVAVDTETTLIVPGEVPRFVVGAAFAGGARVYLLTEKHLRAFCEAHVSSHIIMHNAPFDIGVITQAAGFDFDPQVRGQRLWDTGLMYQLLDLATVGLVPERWALDYLAKKFLGVTIDKDESIRNTFGQFVRGASVDYQSIPEKHLRYAAIDPIVTYQLYAKLTPRIMELSPKFYLSHKIQLMGALGLDAVSRLGIGFDQTQKVRCLLKIDDVIATHLKALNDYQYFPGKPGVQKAFEKIVTGLGCNLPKTAKTKMLSQKTDVLEEFRQTVPFIDAFLSHRESTKLRSFIAKLEGDRIRTRFITLKSTGRTSSREPNLQNLPRASGIRECFIPAPGYKFLIIDYSTLELCTLAQSCFDRFGFSKMRELINSGVDLHTWFASIVTGKPISEVTKDERQAAKAANFGFPGGLGVKTFVQFALNTYGVVIDDARAAELKTQWLKTFPEMALHLADTLLTRHDFSSLEWCEKPEIAASIFKRIIGGEILAKSGKPYGASTLAWAFDTVLADLAPDLLGISMGSFEIRDQVLREAVHTRTGRIRANATYCQARNTPFQGLAADGAKIALYRLVRATRFRSVKAGEMRVKFFRTFTGEPPPERVILVGRHYDNQFQLPMLFFITCLVCMVSNHVHATTLVLAWAFVGTRVLHSWIHLGQNLVHRRALAFAGGWLVLIALWIQIVYSAAYG